MPALKSSNSPYSGRKSSVKVLGSIVATSKMSFSSSIFQRKDSGFVIRSRISIEFFSAFKRRPNEIGTASHAEESSFFAGTAITKYGCIVFVMQEKICGSS